MKSVEEIYGEMLDCFAQRTGTRPAEGCDLAARLYAVAAQVYSLYVQADWAGRQVLPQTAEGEFLDRHAQLRGITRKEAAPATGVIRFTAGETADAARTIPVGTVCMTAGRVRFETTEEGAIQPGELTADVPAQAAEAGSAGNVAAGSVVVMAVAPAGVAACTNPDDRKPNMIQSAFADFFNDINAVRDDIHKDIQRQSKRVEAIEQTGTEEAEPLSSE